MGKKEEAFEVEGTVTQALANTRFRVQLETGHKIIAHVAGRMRKHFIRIVPGDKVRVELSPLPVVSNFRCERGNKLCLDRFRKPRNDRGMHSRFFHLIAGLQDSAPNQYDP